MCCCSNSDITALDTESYTPLMVAASEGHQEAFIALVKRGAAIDDADEDGKTIVHLAAERNHCEVLRVCMCYCLARAMLLYSCYFFPLVCTKGKEREGIAYFD